MYVRPMKSYRYESFVYLKHALKTALLLFSMILNDKSQRRNDRFK